MLRDFLFKYYILIYVRAIFRFFLIKKGPLAVTCIVASGLEGRKKFEAFSRRLEFYWPGVDLDAIRVTDKLRVREAFVGPVLVLDQSLISKNWFRLFDNIFNVDFERNSVDGWALCEFAQYVSGRPSAIRRQAARALWSGRIERLKKLGLNRSYIFGTGNSLEFAGERDFSDGYRIVCNTIVRDPDLWRHLDPHIIVAGDAIYHFGFTDFARAFRSDLKDRLRESKGKVLFVYPELYDEIAQRELSEFRDVLVPVPFGAHTNIVVDLQSDFRIPALGNVLNNLLLPVGATLSRSIWLWGFDGRAPTDTLFWSNSTKHSYPELMPHLIAAHPAFYETLVPKNQESNYVKSVHGDALDKRMNFAERCGYEFVMMHKTWTETLQKRYRGGH
jgi:hypothetical protein